MFITCTCIKEQREDGKEEGKWGKRGRSYLAGFYQEECCQLKKREKQ